MAIPENIHIYVCITINEKGGHKFEKKQEEGFFFWRDWRGDEKV